MAHPGYSITTMQRSEVDLAIEWAAREGWNPGLHDADSFYAVDPGGFLVGRLDNEPIAVISAMRYDSSFGFIGFYIVRPDWRGKGYGLRIWQAAMARLKGCNIGLDGVVEQQANYRKSGFSLAYRNIRHQGRVVHPPFDDRGIVALCDLPLERVARYDSALFPVDRGRFVASWIAQPDSIALGVEEDGRLAGYGVLRACRSGYKVGPLFADSAPLAERLFLALQRDIEPDAPLYFDTPEGNAQAVALAKGHGMQPVFETARMYTGPAPDLPLQRIFGVTSFELG